jgi:glucosamine--fructose-6-phosphate aminotransferase (isomerizing)
MCGIVAYVGAADCAPILVEGLRRLEYRGYDSAGLAVHTGRSVETVRTVGKLVHLAEALEKTPLRGGTGIGHTRWATHGRPCALNAHPHTSGPVAVVHNGIIENHASLRRAMEARGVRFSSDTDTEIIAHLIAEALQRGQDVPRRPSLEQAVRTALAQVRGAYAIAVLSNDDPDKVVVAMQEVRAREGRVFSVVTQGDRDAESLSEASFVLPPAHDAVLPLLSVVTMQLLSYSIAVLRGLDVDQPRNLAKTVTVE